MIRVFNANDRDFTSNGNAVIVPIKAKVKNQLNGDFYLDLTCESKFYDYLSRGDLIIAPTPQGEQAFRIGNTLQRKGDRITLKANHVYYDSLNYVIADSYAVELTCKQALNHFNNATDTRSPFIMDSNITTVNNFRCVRKSLTEAVNTVIERWGGYLVRDNWKISVMQSIGRDYGVTIKYAKNLTELTASYDFSGVCTKLLPVGKDGILLPELYVYANKQYEIPYTKVLSIDQDFDQKEFPSEEAYVQAVIADLRVKAQKIVNSSCYPVVTYTLKGKPEIIQDIGDIIQVKDERIGVDITTQVIGYEWDIVTESYSNLTFGNFGNSLNDLMGKVSSNTKATVNEAVGQVKGDFKDSITKIYDLLQNSYVYYRGYDILILDKIPASTAVNVLRFSNDGISVSSSGINGTYTTIYDLNTKVLSVPALKLNGADLQTVLTTMQTQINGKQERLTAGNGIKISRNVISATYTGLQWWKETSNKFYREGTHEGTSGAVNYLKPSNNEVGYYLNGQGWFRCIVVRLKGNPHNVIMGLTSHVGDVHPIIAYASLDELDFEWGYSNNTLTPPYGVTEWFDKSTYPVTTGDAYFGYGTATVTYNGATWNILAVDCLYWNGGDGVEASDGIASFSTGKWTTQPNISLIGMDLVEIANATPLIEVATEIGVENYAFKYGGSGETFASIDTDGNAYFNSITTKGGAVQSKITPNPSGSSTASLSKLEIDGTIYGFAGGGGGGNITLLASPPSGATYFPLNVNTTLLDDITNYDCIMFCPVYSGNPSAIAYPPAIYPVDYFKACSDRVFTYYATAGYNDVKYINDTTIMFLRNAGETVCNAVYGIKY